MFDDFDTQVQVEEQEIDFFDAMAELMFLAMAEVDEKEINED